MMDCEGYRKLRATAERYEVEAPGSHNYMEKVSWAVERAKHYAAKTGLKATVILDAWEDQRDYWYMNYYQESRQPKINSENVWVFDTVESLKSSIGDAGFRCPACGGVSSDPTVCDTGILNTDKAPCDWKAYGLFGTLGKGAYVFVKSELRGQDVFKPVAWETS